MFLVSRLYIGLENMANKNPYSQSHGFLISHVWMWELELAECWRIDAFKLWC